MAPPRLRNDRFANPPLGPATDYVGSKILLYSNRRGTHQAGQTVVGPPDGSFALILACLTEVKSRELKKSRNATSLNSRFKSLDRHNGKIISVKLRRVIRKNHKKGSKIWRHENIQLGGCQS